jgi:hypothetical protein
MPRVREITMDGVTVRISPLSYDEAEKYITESKELASRQPPLSTDEWLKRQWDSVVFTLNKATPKTENERWTVEKLKSEFDMLLIAHIYEQFMQMSGVVSVPKGEAEATPSTSR